MFKGCTIAMGPAKLMITERTKLLKDYVFNMRMSKNYWLKKCVFEIGVEGSGAFVCKALWSAYICEALIDLPFVVLEIKGVLVV